MEIQYTGDNVKEIIEFCGECIDGYWCTGSKSGLLDGALAFMSKHNISIPLIKGHWVLNHREGFIMVSDTGNIMASSKQGIHNGTKQGTKSRLETNEA